MDEVAGGKLLCNSRTDGWFKALLSIAHDNSVGTKTQAQVTLYLQGWRVGCECVSRCLARGGSRSGMATLARTGTARCLNISSDLVVSSSGRDG